MPEPVFDATERVPTNSAPQLPKELEGKSPAEIVNYYAKREQGIITQAREAIRANDPTKIPGEKPNTSVRMERPVENVPAAELDGARATLAAAAETQAKQGKKYWTRFEAEIRGVMSKMALENRVDFNYWEAVYFNLVGQHKDVLETEEREAAAAATRLAAERANAPPEPAGTPPPALPAKVMEKVLPGLGITEDRYRKAATQIEKGEWPLTGVGTRS
jgi:hypothetical protein